MSAKTEAEICIGPMCYKPEPTTVQAQPTNSDLVTMIFENLTKTVHQYLTRGKNMANNYLFENYIQLLNQVMILIAIISIYRCAIEFIKGRHRTPENLDTKQTCSQTKSETIVNLHNTMRCEPNTRDNSTFRMQSHAQSDTEKQSGIFARTQSLKEPLEKYGNDLILLGKELFRDEEMLKYIFSRGIRNYKLRERVIEKYLTQKEIPERKFSIEDLIDYAKRQEFILKNTESMSADSMATETEESRFRNRNKSFNDQQRSNTGRNGQRYTNDNQYQPTQKPNWQQNKQHNIQPQNTNNYEAQKQPAQGTNLNAYMSEENNNKRPTVEPVNPDPITGNIVINGVITRYLCDTGASRSVISKQLYDKLKCESPARVKMRPYVGVGVESINAKINIAGIVTIKSIKIYDEIKIYNTKLLILENLNQFDCILGRDILSLIPDINESMNNLRRYASGCIEQLRKPQSSDSNSDTELHDDEIKIKDNGNTIIFPGFLDNREASVKIKKIARQDKDSITDRKETDLNNIVDNEQFIVTTGNRNEIESARQEIQTELQKCAVKSLSQVNPEILRKMEFLVELKDPYQKPIKFKARPLPFAIKEQVKEALNEQIDAGLIRKSRSEWAAPLHVVHKPDGSVRLTVDFKGLNEVIKFDPYPMPNSKDLFSKLTQSKYFSKLDFIKAYHQFPTAKESIKYTSFICEFGQYEYPTMPMGIKTAAAWFQRCVDQVLKPFIDDGVVQAYMDDVILHTETVEEHNRIAKALLKTIELAGLKVSINKCEI